MSVEPIETMAELRWAISEVIAYNYADEAQDYKNHRDEGNTGPHIFETLERLRYWVAPD